MVQTVIRISCVLSKFFVYYFMPYFSTIRNIVIGDSFSIARAVSLTPDLDALTDAWFTIILPTWVVGMQRHITTSTPASEGFIVNNTTDASLIFIMTSGMTSPLYAETPYDYDIQVKDTDGHVHTIETGKIILEAQATYTF